MSRVNQRSKMDEPTRITLLEADQDELEGIVRGMQKILFGILISTTTAALLLAINLIANNGTP